MKKTVTFGVAAYNAQKYLDKCLTSFLNPQVLDQIEVIVVNDGSTDGTGKLVSEYVKKYPHTIKLITQENKGHGGALNTAIANASGEFFKAIDADDWVVTENLPAYVQTLENTEADAVINSFHTVNMENGDIQAFSSECEKSNKLISVEELMEVYDKISLCCSFHGITYRTKTYRKADFALSEKIFYEDNEYAIVPFICVKKLMINPLYLYQYQIGNGEQSVAFHNQVKRISHIGQVIMRILEYRSLNKKLLTDAQDEYYMRKLTVVLVSYYATALAKNPNKKAGRNDAVNFYAKIDKIEPQLNVRAKRKYRTLYIFNLLRVPTGVFQRIWNTDFYNKIRRIWIKR